MWDVAVDLLLGSRCAGCGSPGRVLCPGCAASLPTSGRAARPTPCPPGLAPAFAAGDYDGTLRRLLLAHKEDRVLALAGPLGAVLVAVVGDLLTATGRAGQPARLVPVPSRPAAVRERGHDPVLRMARQAARCGTSAGPVSVTPVLRVARRLADQAGLSAGDRAANLCGALRARSGPPGAGTGRPGAVVVDDVLTTGATAREAQRALEAAGWTVLGVAAVAATQRRGPGSGGSLPFRRAGD